MVSRSGLGDWAREGGCDAADFNSRPAEIDQQAQGLARRPQVVAALRDMHVAQRADHLELPGPNNASPPSICIPFIRLKKPALASVPTPDVGQMSYITNVDEP
jgi:hypothetical protein